MAGINPNLGNNLKLQNLQLSKTVNVDTQNNKGKKVGDAKPAAVWISNWNKPGIGSSKGRDLKLGDVVIILAGDNVSYYRVTLDEQGERIYLPISAADVQDRDFETDRGDLRGW